MSDQTDGRTSRLHFLRRHRTVVTIGAVVLASAVGAALIGGAISASGSDRAPETPPNDEVDFGSPPPEVRDFEQCMEDHGAVLPPPPGSGDERAGDRLVLPENPQEARSDCGRKLGTPPDDAELRARIELHIRCMRGHGVDLPDPPPEGPFSVELPRNDPDVDAARQACDDLLFEDSRK